MVKRLINALIIILSCGVLASGEAVKLLRAAPEGGMSDSDNALERPIEEEYERLHVQLEELVKRRTSLEIRASGMAAQVTELKARLATESSRMDEFRLRDRLRESQVLADSLDELNITLARLAGEVKKRSLKFSGLYTAAIDSVSLELGDPLVERHAKEDLLRELDRLRKGREALLREQALMSAAIENTRGKGPGERRGRTGRPSLSIGKLAQAVRIRPEDSREEILEKADFIEDVAGKWKRALAALEKNIDHIEEESAVRKRLGEFAQEIALFDEAGVSSRAQQKRPGPADLAPQPGGEGDKSFAWPADGEAPIDMGMETIDRSENQGPEAAALDLELLDPESDLWLLQALEGISADDLEAAVRLLEARRDSIEKDLKSLEELEKIIRKEA
ncbi:MAG: hypothetical protein U9N45_06395, partial [Gemmatimonadota bacterium]|nr:hypothetical protein [Gemmatimonadota bacterium]